MLQRSPPGYFEQDGCHNCIHLDEKIIIDDGTYEDPEEPIVIRTCTCTRNAPPKPEEPLIAPTTSTGHFDYRQALSKWRDGRAVNPHGTCPVW